MQSSSIFILANAKQTALEAPPALIDPTKENKNRFKGSSGEAQASLALFIRLSSEYVVLSNVTVPTPKGTTQIDHVIVSPYGIFVVESKNIKGSIYGTQDQPKWTVCLGNKKFQMPNPIHQNWAHIKALSVAISVTEEKFHSLVFFWADNCRFKTEMPDNVLREGLTGYIKNKTTVLIPHAKIQDIVNAINTASLPKNHETETAHVNNLKERFHSQHTSGNDCPRCTGKLLERTAKATGQKFLGCNQFPKCRYTEKTT